MTLQTFWEAMTILILLFLMFGCAPKWERYDKERDKTEQTAADVDPWGLSRERI